MSVYEDKTILVFCIVVASMLGAVFGSFLNCAAWRIAHHESFLKGRSKCPKCGHELGFFELIPILGWIILGGKCKQCREKISIRYPLTELFFAVITVLCLLRFDLTVLALRNWVFLACLFCLSLVDLEICEIPNGCLIIAAAAWALALPFIVKDWSTEWKDVLLHIGAGLAFGGGMLLISLVMDKILKRESLGGGDIKLFAVVGLYLGFLGSLLAVITACVLGLLFVLARKLLKRDKDGGQIPFGPSIALAAAFVLLYGSGIIDAYIGLFSA